MEFIKPSEKYLRDYYDAVRESYENNVTEWQPFFLESYEEWSRIVPELFARCENGEVEGYPRTATYWLVDGGSFIGEVQIRPYLSGNEADEIGHIGYGVRFSKQRMGYGTKIVKFGIEKLHEMNINPVIALCGRTNEASKRTLIKCGGVFAGKKTVGGEVEDMYLFEKSL